MSFNIFLVLKSNFISNPVSDFILNFISNFISNSASDSISNSLESESILFFKRIYVFRLVSMSKSGL